MKYYPEVNNRLLKLSNINDELIKDFSKFLKEDDATLKSIYYQLNGFVDRIYKMRYHLGQANFVDPKYLKGGNK